MYAMYWFVLQVVNQLESVELEQVALTSKVLHALLLHDAISRGQARVTEACGAYNAALRAEMKDLKAEILYVYASYYGMVVLKSYVLCHCDTHTQPIPNSCRSAADLFI